MPISREVKKGQTILYQGEAPASIFVIKRGLVRALNISSAGEEKTTALFGERDYFPIECAFHKSPVALLYYESMIDTHLELFSREEFSEYLKIDSSNEMGKLATQYVSSLLQINALGQTLAREKIARILQFLCLRFGKVAPGGVFMQINTPLTQLDIARMAGLTRETTAIEINNLKKSKIIKVNQKFYSVHVNKLVNSTDNDEFNGISL